jgi:hypothetical protein
VGTRVSHYPNARRSVPPDLRPHDWETLIELLRSHGWSEPAIAARLRQAATIAHTPGYIVATIRAMLSEQPPQPRRRRQAGKPQQAKRKARNK